MVKKYFPSFFAVSAGLIHLTANVIDILVLHFLTVQTLYLLVSYTFLIESIFAGLGGTILLYEGITSYRHQMMPAKVWLKWGAILGLLGLAISILELLTFGPPLPAQIGYSAALTLTAFRGIGVQLSLIALREAKARIHEETPV
ncbi:MAG: hypothetical protein GWO20_19035 [Candidatus Korarchaeota archaeon]|nr:hypothetical protein [Candidatus Korarchaeota archaeon]NIU85351.1 hypothetical protein [Candidatus Thorarchaeota archaeon]NIW15449.1 hypothetical protein [Candidatus Thorarchaeota archaeon]NIW53393.1 hypothetical protein [Candidatus Korarchaeota archaeon]